MSVIDKLNNIINCKNAIRAAINNKGGVLTESSKLKDYATAIDNLTAGGGSENRSGLIEVKSLPDNKYDTTSIYTTPHKVNDILINAQVKGVANEAILFSKLSVELGAPLTGGEVVDSLPTENIVETTQTSGFYVYYSISNNEAYMYSTELGGWKPLSEFFCTLFEGILMPCKGFINSKLNGVVLGHGYYIVNADDYYKYFNIWEEITYSGDGSDVIDSGFDLPEKNIDKDKVYKVKYFDDIYVVLEEGEAGFYLDGNLFLLCGIEVCDELPTNNIIYPLEGSEGHFQYVYYVKNKDVYAYAPETKKLESFSEVFSNVIHTTISFKGEVDENNNSNNTTLGIYAAYRYRYYRSTSQAEKLKHNSQELNVTPSTESQEFETTGNNYYSRVTVEPVTSTIDTNIVPENIAKDVTILGVTGTLAGEIPGTRYYIPDSSNKYQLDIVADDANLNRVDITSSVTGDTAVNIYATEKTTNVALNGGSNGDLIGTVKIATTNYTGTIVADNLVPENIAKGKTILGVEGTLESDAGVIVTSNIKITNSTNDILSGETDKLYILNNQNNLKYKISNVVEYNEYSSQLMSAALSRNLYASCCAKYGNYVYLFGGYSSGYSYYIFKFDFINETSSILNEVLPQRLKDACCEIYGDNIYIFGGYNGNTSLKTIYKFNCKTETIETLSTTLPKTLFNACCSINGDNIYIFGGKNSGTALDTIYKFNCTTETIETLSVTLSQPIYGACCSIYKDNIYIFGGKSGSSIQSSIYKFNCLTETISTLTVSLLYPMYDGCCECYDNIIYILGGYNDFQTSNKIYKFNCDNETIESSARVLQYTLKESSCAMHGNKIYTFGGYVGGSSSRIILELTIRIRLPSNTALIYNANGKYNFDLIPDQLTIPIKGVYIGNSDGDAQLANAYIYKRNNWYNINTDEKLTA